VSKKKNGIPLTELAAFGELLMPGEAAEPILARSVRNALLEWLTEFWAKEDLQAVGLKPRQRAIFTGPPGVGKTTLAHHLAARLGLVMLAVRPERLVNKWLGSTGRNIGGLFDMVREAQEPVFLFFDEFDAIAIQRKAAEQSTDEERNGWVNTLLQCIDRYDGFFVAATNFAGAIDQAIWRRFQMQITLELPGQPERRRILARYLDPYGLPRPQLELLAEAFETASPALMREACENLKRQLVIGPRVKWSMDKASVFARMLATIQPHPDLGKPRLWSLGVDDQAVRSMAWPLSLAKDLPAEAAPSSAEKSDGGAIISFPPRKELAPVPGGDDAA
jgi:hypothetical protein